jgi:hypothetical protein
MSKIKEAYDQGAYRPNKHATGTDVALPSKASLFVATTHIENPLMAAAAEDAPQPASFIGTRLKINGQTGKFVWKTKDENGQESAGTLPVGTEMVAALDMSVWGWLRRQDNATVEKHVALMGDPAYRHPPRDALDYLDEREWPRGKYGADDPWLEIRNLPMWRLSDRQWFTMMVPTKMSVENRRKGIKNRGVQRHAFLLQQAARSPLSGFNPAMGTFESYPVVRLAVGSYESKAGPVYYPDFRMTGKWVAKIETPPHPNSGDAGDTMDEGDSPQPIGPGYGSRAIDHQYGENDDRGLPDYIDAGPEDRIPF